MLLSFNAIAQAAFVLFTIAFWMWLSYNAIMYIMFKPINERVCMKMAKRILRPFRQVKMSDKEMMLIWLLFTLMEVAIVVSIMCWAFIVKDETFHFVLFSYLFMISISVVMSTRRYLQPLNEESASSNA